MNQYKSFLHITINKSVYINPLCACVGNPVPRMVGSLSEGHDPIYWQDYLPLDIEAQKRRIPDRSFRYGPDVDVDLGAPL